PQYSGKPRSSPHAEIQNRQPSSIIFYQRSGRLPRNGAPPLSLWCGSEEDFHRQLSDAGIGGLARTERAEGSVAIQLVKGTDLVGAVDNTTAGTFRREVRMVEDVEVFGAKLELPALREV